jgi:hypothetical protein
LKEEIVRKKKQSKKNFNIKNSNKKKIRFDRKKIKNDEIVKKKKKFKNHHK